MPVRDARPWLASSLASLGRQSFADFEIIAVDDGSTDGSGEWLERAMGDEPRLRVHRGPAHGLPAALNTALALARAPLIARHDADDVSHRERLALQVSHLRAHPGDAVVGSRIRLFPALSVGTGMRRWAAWHNALLTHDAMAGEVLIDSPLTHGTALLRRAWLERVGGWAERGWAEDLDLWIRMLEAGARFAKRPEVLYGWRQHRASATRRDPRYRRDRFVALKLDALDRGLLRGSPALTLVGVGESLARARAAFAAARDVMAIEARRPTPRVVAALAPPIVLVFGAPPARARWRMALLAAGLVEGRAFAFVA
jgi:glycosyltransferase involved in cell wall biosynthesis